MSAATTGGVVLRVHTDVDVDGEDAPPEVEAGGHRGTQGLARASNALIVVNHRD